MFNRYRKKPVIINAVQWTGGNLFEVRAFLDGHPPKLDTPMAQNKWAEYQDQIFWTGLTIPTFEGDMRAQVHDYIIKGVKGEFYPCTPDIFHATYEKVED